ncbi:hypothetical protein ES705_50373 [subsurface metagenome]
MEIIISDVGLDYISDLFHNHIQFVQILLLFLYHLYGFQQEIWIAIIYCIDKAGTI